MDHQKRLIESDEFPIKAVSDASAREKEGPGGPLIWRMIFWWTRKPLISARSIIAASILPTGIDVNKFSKMLMLDKSTSHRFNPNIPDEWQPYFKGKRILDLFAGFGSIPLESIRLGLETTCVDLLPPSYIFMKAIMDYPLRNDQNLENDLTRMGQWVTETLEKDESINQLYDPGVHAYVGSWKVRCPHCGKMTPLISNYWLSRGSVKKDESNELVWMEPVIRNDNEVSMSVKCLRSNNNKLIKINKNKITLNDDETINVPDPNIHARSERASCLNPDCTGKIRFIDTESHKHYLDKSKAPNNKKLEWYVKYALRKYNEGDRNIAEPTVFVKVRKNKGKLQFEECTGEDQNKIKLAANEIEKLTGRSDPDIPTELLAPYGNRYLAPLNYGMKKWMEIFNPRQLLVLVKLLKLIRMAGKVLEEEKIEHGFDPIKAHSYVECVVVYLAIALTRYAMFNSLFSSIRASTMMGSIVAECLRYRGIGPVWNWGELHPTADITGSWTRNLKTTTSILKFLLKIYHQNKLENYDNRIRSDNKYPNANILLDDATTLKFSDKFDVVITDPPYFGDVPYSELSDFYFVWLKRALSDVYEDRLSPKFVINAFFKKIWGRYIERQTQWEEFALRG